MTIMLLIVATRYDEVTLRTCGVAEYLNRQGDELQLGVVALLEDEATGDRLRQEIGPAFRAFAFYSHGDETGRILGQDRLPMWTEDRLPDFQGGAIFVHACRAMLSLEGDFSRLNARIAAGYRIDLKLPANGSEAFWHCYCRLHAFLPLRFAQLAPPETTRTSFYEFATDCLAETRRRGGGLIELIALQQSRDDLEILSRVWSGLPQRF